MPNWILQMVISYVLTQLANLGTSINWTQVATEAVSHVLAAVDKYLPAFVQTFVNPAVSALVSGAVAALSLAMGDSTDLALVVGDLEAKDWQKALADVEALLGKVVHPHQAATLAAVQQLKAAA